VWLELKKRVIKAKLFLKYIYIYIYIYIYENQKLKIGVENVCFSPMEIDKSIIKTKVKNVDNL
jgi:hypothetical protein